MDSPAPAARFPSAKSLFAWGSVILLFISMLVPVAQAPILGTINVFGFQDGTPYWFLGLAILAASATFFKRYRLLIVSGLFVVVSSLYYAYHLESMKADLLKGMEDNAFSGLLTGVASTIHLQWGIVSLVVSGVALVVAGVLRDDAETLPQLFAANRLQFVRAAIGVAVLLLGIAILPALLPHFAARSASSSSGNPLSAITTPTRANDDSTPAPDPKVASMRQLATVGILQKGFHEKDIENGDYDDQFTVTTQYHNLSKKTISGIKGSLEFVDQFGSNVAGFKIEYQENLAPGAVAAVPEFYEYNEFKDSDNKLRTTPLRKLKIVWNPEKINFADGTSVHLEDN